MASALPTAISPHNRISLRRLGQSLLLLLILGLCVTNVLLIKQNRDLKAAIAHQQPEFLTPGQQVPSFTANILLPVSGTS